MLFDLSETSELSSTHPKEYQNCPDAPRCHLARSKASATSTCCASSCARHHLFFEESDPHETQEQPAREKPRQSLNATGFAAFSVAGSKPWWSLCVQFFAPPSTPCLWLCLGFGLLALLTHGGWTTEFGAHRAAFTVHAPARHGSSCTFCSAGPWGAGYPVFGQVHCPVFGQDWHIRRISTLATHNGWTTEFCAQRATFTVHAPARRAASVAKLHLVLHDLAAGLHRPRRSGISILNSRRQLFRVDRDFADS